MLRWILIALSLWLFSTLLVAVLGRVGHPFGLEWMEGAMVDHVARLLRGEKIYVAPSVEFVPFVYPPVFHVASAAVAKVAGLGFPALRVVSVMATLGSLVCVFAFVVREGGSRLAGIVGAGFFAGTYPLSGYFFDLGRVDALFVCFVLWSAYAIRFVRGAGGIVGAAVLLTLAYFTKQPALIMGPALFAYLFLVDRRRALWFGGTLLTLVIGSSVAIDSVHQGWFGYYTHRVVTGHAMVWEGLVPFLRFELLYPCGMALGVSWLFWLGAPTARGHGRAFHGLCFAALLLMTLTGRLHSGGWINVLVPLHAGLAILFGLGVGVALDPNAWPNERRGSYLGLVLACLQLGVLLWDPRPSIPTREDREAGRALVEKLRTGGAVWTTHRGTLTAMAGKPTHAHMMAMHDVMRSSSDFRGAKGKLTQEVKSALAEGRFDRVLMDNLDFWFLPDLDRHYVRDGGRWFPDADSFWPRSGARLRPELGYVRRPSASKP